MAVDVVMPQMGESIFEGTITKWLKKPGDKVERDEPLFEISTDKVDAEIPSPSAGVLKEIKVNEGQTVPIQTVVAVIDARGRRAAAAPAPAAAPLHLRQAAAPKPQLAAPPAPAPAGQACAQPLPHRRASCSACVVRERRRAHSQLAAGAPHGQGTRHRSLEPFPGTGAGGRISKQDIEAVISGGGRLRTAQPTEASALGRSSGRCRASTPRRHVATPPPPPAHRLRCQRSASGARLRNTSGVRIGRAARTHVLRQLRSAAHEHHAPAHRRAHGGLEARFAARLLGRRNRHDQDRRAARQVQGRVRKALRDQADLHAVLREGCRRRACARFPR